MPKPTVFGRYLLLDRIAYGGMAEVFRGKQFGEEGFDRIIAIKRVLPAVADNDQFLAMFRDEANITRTLQHGNIAQVYDFGKLDGRYYLAMEYVSGLDLKAYFTACEKAGKPMDPAIAALIVREVALGLGYAHRATDSAGSSLGLIHRDVSPQNILLSWQGEVKLVDFGIAKARQKTQRTDAGVLKGKFGYMSPEQVRGLPLSNRSDLFSLGTVFWELLTGHRAFDRETDYETMDAVRAVDLPPFEQAAQAIPKALQDICLKALSKDEEERYARAEHMARDITRWLSAQDEQTSQLELSTALTETFASQHQAERKLLASYERYGASMVETQIRSAGAERETPAVQVGVSQNRQHVPAQRVATPAPTAPLTPTPSGVRMHEPAPTLAPPNASRGPAVIATLAAILTVAIGWQAWMWWSTRPGSLQISAMPAKVKVFVNSELMGETKPAPDGRGSLLIGEIPYGEVTVLLEADGHSSLTEKINIRPAQTFAWQPNLPQEALPDAQIELRVTPQEALVTFGEDEHKLEDGQVALILGDGDKKDLYVRANNYRPYRQTVGPLKPGSRSKIDVALVMERWNLEVVPEPADARVKLTSTGLATIAGKGAQTLRGLQPKASVQVSVSRSRCRRYRRRITNHGAGQQTLKVTLRCR